MDDKPVTDLVLLPPLGLIPVESLPKRCSEELASLKYQRKLALSRLRTSLVVTSGFSVSTVFVSYLAFLAWAGGAPIVISLLITASLVVLATASVFFMRDHALDARRYQEIEISPQLQIGAENERVLSEMVQLTNTQIISWNKRTECAPAEDIDKRFLKGLKNERLLLSANIEKVKSVAKAIEQDGFERKTKEEPETE